MSARVSRLFQPKSIAVVGGGAWCAQVIAQSVKMGFGGAIWPVHPTAKTIAGHPAYSSVDALPAVPDAVFIGVNRRLTIDIVARLADLGAGGAVCFASGFSEAMAEDEDAGGLQDKLVVAAGDMPILGPNCYGFINALDGALLWPDQHGCVSVARGVAILTQSSNIAINLTMQQRSLPIAYVVTCGNMAQTAQAGIAASLLDDPRVTAIGLHVEGFACLRDWEHLARKAYAKGVPLVVLKVGASMQAQHATISHTASLAGSDAGADAVLRRLGIPRVHRLPDLLEALKLLHCYGPLPDTHIGSISCSGGEASLIADLALDYDITFPPLTDDQRDALAAALGPMVALSNPLDYNTYIWRDTQAMTRAWGALTGGDITMTLSVVDYPITDAADWTHATAAAVNVRAQTGARFGVVASLPELMPVDVADTLLAEGVVPFAGLDGALAAIRAAASFAPPNASDLWKAPTVTTPQTLTEAAAKTALAAYGVSVPRGVVVRAGDDLTPALAAIPAPYVVKGMGLAHKSEHGAVALGVRASDVAAAIHSIGTAEVLIEEMLAAPVAELLVGVVADPAHGFVLTLGAGGVLTEVLCDTISLMLPVKAEDVENALMQLKIAPVLRGYRGKPAADLGAITEAVLAAQAYVRDHMDSVTEIEMNPLMCLPHGAVAADALMRKA